jgi:NADH-quinone oxidoreductase subunit M
MKELLWATLLIPFAGAGLILLLPARKGRAIRGTAILAALAALAGALALYRGFPAAAGDFRFESRIDWIPSLGVSLHLGLDGLSLPLLVTAAVVGLAAVLSGGSPDRGKEYYLLLTLTLGAALSAFASLDLFFFYFFCEATTIPKYLLTAVWGRLPAGRYRTTREAAAMQVTLFIAAGAMAVLVALALLYSVGGGTMDVQQLRLHFAADPGSVGPQRWIFGGLLLGFGIWSAMWPFHTWSPLTYAAMPAPAAMLFAGVAKNFGAYGLLRIGTQVMPAGARAWAEPLAVIAIVNILYGGWAAMRQKDWSFIVAYSSISHVGYLLLALAAALGPVGSPAVTAAVFFMLAHSLSVALLFALVGNLEQSAGSRFPEDLGGLARSLPYLAVAFAVAVIAASGLPGSANFVAEVLVFFSAWSQGGLVFRLGAIAAVWGVVMTATYLFRALRSTFHGESRRPAGPSGPPALALRIAIALLILSSALAGVWPRLVTRALRPAAGIVPAGFARPPGANGMP